MAFSVAPTVQLCAQTVAPTGSLSGAVLTDSGDVPIANAEISFPNVNLSARSDSKGNFQIIGVPPGPQELIVRQVGYEPYEATVTFRTGQKVETDIFLKRIVTKLANVKIKAVANPRYATRLVDFEERRRFGIWFCKAGDPVRRSLTSTVSTRIR